MTEAARATQGPAQQIIRLFADPDHRQEILTLAWTGEWPPPSRLARAVHKGGSDEVLMTEAGYEDALDRAEDAGTTLEAHYDITWFERTRTSRLSDEDVAPGTYLARGAAYVQLAPEGLDIRCNGCHKTPDEIGEYIDQAREAGTTPTAFVIEQEGTYNKGNGHFLCTECYVQAGMPSLPAPRQWVAP